jgi:anti-sigma-K factor RskA
MRLATSAALDALCGEYLVGTLRGTARRRFERARREEPLVAQRLDYWQDLIAPRYTKMMSEAHPPAAVWSRLERELGLSRYRTPWYRRTGFWRGWAVAATAALLLVLGVQLAREAPPPVQIAQLTGQDQTAVVTAHLSGDGRTLELHASRPVIAGPAQSYELWLLTPDGAVLSVAVLGSLDARFEVPEGQRRRLREGGRLAVSVEPAGGSPTGRATGPVILLGPITI